MSRPALEVADIFRDHGAAWRTANAGHVSLNQLKVMAAIENCRTAALGGHVLRCEKCCLTDSKAFAAYLRPLRNSKWVVYCKDPFGGPEQVLRYLARYTHRVAISNRRLIACDEKGITFKWKDYRLEGPARYKIMTLTTDEFIRRFLMHVLPTGFHRIRYYGLLASGNRAENIARARELLTPPMLPIEAIKAIGGNASKQTAEPQTERHPCPCCGGHMIFIERFERRCQPKHQPSPVPAPIRIDTS